MLILLCYLMMLICDDLLSRLKVKLFDFICNFFFKYSNLLYINIYIYFYIWFVECMWDIDGGECIVLKSSGYCLFYFRKVLFCYWKIIFKLVFKDVFIILFICIILYLYIIGMVKREWLLLELNIFKFYLIFSLYVYVIR